MSNSLYNIHKVTDKDISTLWSFDIDVRTISSKGNMQRNPRMSSMSPNAFKFFKTTWLFALSRCTFMTTKGGYFLYTCFVKNNMEIHLVFTFQINSFPFKFIRLAGYWNLANSLGAENCLRCTTQDEKGLVLTTILFYFIFWSP